MAFKRSNTKSVRLTGLFKTKRPGLFVGTCRAEDLKQLIAKIKAAKEEDKGLTFFVWKNQGEGPTLSLSVDVEQERPARTSRKPIEEDEFETKGDDSLFGDD